MRKQVIGTHDIVPTFVELAGGKAGPGQMLDSVSLAPVLLGTRGDDQPVRETLLIQSSPGRDAFTEGGPKAKPARKGQRLTPAEKRTEGNRAWDETAKKGARSGSHGMAHALRQGPWKLVFDIANNKPAALYQLDDDLSEKNNLIADPAHAERVQRMEQLYREIRTSKRSTPVMEQSP